jgi:hypothetical protein
LTTKGGNNGANRLPTWTRDREAQSRDRGAIQRRRTGALGAIGSARHPMTKDVLRCGCHGIYNEGTGEIITLCFLDSSLLPRRRQDRPRHVRGSTLGPGRWRHRRATRPSPACSRGGQPRIAEIHDEGAAVSSISGIRGSPSRRRRGIPILYRSQQTYESLSGREK